MNLKETIINKFPIDPYFTSVYVTLFSMASSASISSILIFAYDDGFDVNNIILNLKVLNSVILTAIIWHHFIVHQKFVSWFFDLTDTLGPFSFTSLLVFVALTIKDETNTIFILFTLFSIGACFSYYDAIRKITKNKDIILNIYKFLLKDKEFSIKLYNTIVEFDKKLTLTLFLISLLLIVITIFIFLNEEYRYYIQITYLVLYTIGLIIISKQNLFENIDKCIIEFETSNKK